MAKNPSSWAYAQGAPPERRTYASAKAKTRNGAAFLRRAVKKIGTFGKIVPSKVADEDRLGQPDANAPRSRRRHF
jgi:hypothetical protein